MSKFLIQANYVGEGLKGLMKEGGTKRRETVAQVIEGMGGKLESFYYAFGDFDVLGIADMPDNVSAVAFSMMINASGAVQGKTVVLLSPEEIDQATKKTVNYRPPGKQRYSVRLDKGSKHSEQGEMDSQAFNVLLFVLSEKAAKKLSVVLALNTPAEPELFF